MNQLGTTVLTIVLSAFVGTVTAIFVERIKLNYRLRVENEYRILQKIWEKAYWLKSRANNLRPMLDSLDPTELDEDRKRRRLELFAKAMDEYEQEMYLNKPFYPERIYRLLKELRTSAHMEAFDYSQTSANRIEYYWKNAVANAKTINDLVEQICDAIRGHLHGK